MNKEEFKLTIIIIDEPTVPNRKPLKTKQQKNGNNYQCNSS